MFRRWLSSVPWCRSLHNTIIIRTLYLYNWYTGFIDESSQHRSVMVRRKSHQSLLSHSPPPLPRLLRHTWIDNKHEKSFLQCRATDCQEELVCSTPPFLHWAAGLTSWRQKNCREVARQISFKGKTGQRFKWRECTRCRIHFIWLQWHVNYLTKWQEMRKIYEGANQEWNFKCNSWFITSGSDWTQITGGGNWLTQQNQHSFNINTIIGDVVVNKSEVLSLKFWYIETQRGTVTSPWQHKFLVSAVRTEKGEQTSQKTL